MKKKLKFTQYILYYLFFLITTTALISTYSGICRAAGSLPYLQVKSVSRMVDPANPSAKIWKTAPYKIVPLNVQTYSVKKVQLKGLVSGNKIYFRLKWADATKNDKIVFPNQFVDGAAIAFPVYSNRPLPFICMGEPNDPVNIIHWRANFKNNHAEDLIAGSPGTLTKTEDKLVHANAVWKNKKWFVVFSRPLNDKNEPVLKKGNLYHVAIAIWNGADRERAMKKSVSYWTGVKIDR